MENCLDYSGTGWYLMVMLNHQATAAANEQANETKETPTPGPWRLLQTQYATWVVAGPEGEPFKGHVIASRTTCSDWPANARLIAAAPDLYAACLRLITNLDNGHPLSGAFLNIRDALAKAEGKE